MSNILVLYHSKYGTTKKYAEALARELSCPAINQETARPQDLTLADTLVFGSSIRASGVGFGKFVKAHADILENKRLIFFCVGASPDPEQGSTILQDLRQKSMGKLFPNAPIFYCRGEWDMDSMTTMDRLLCKALLKVLEKKDVKEMEPWERALHDAQQDKASWYDEKYLKPIIAAARGEGID